MEPVTDDATIPTPAGDELRELVRRAEAGDAGVLPALRAFLDGRPEVWREAGDLGLQARRAWTALAAGPNLLLSESLARQAEAVRAAAAGPRPGPLDGLLADRVALTWLAAAYFDAVLAQQKKAGGLTPAQAEHLQRCQERAHRQHLQAVRALAVVRKLLPGAAAGAAPAAAPHPGRTRRGRAVRRDRLQAAGVPR